MNQIRNTAELFNCILKVFIPCLSNQNLFDLVRIQLINDSKIHE